MCCPAFFAISQKIFEMSELCNNSACFSVEIKGTSDICVTFVVYACGKSILGVRTHEKDTADRRQRHLYMVPAKILTAPGLPGKNGLYAERSADRHPRGNAAGGADPIRLFHRPDLLNKRLFFQISSCVRNQGELHNQQDC